MNHCFGSITDLLALYFGEDMPKQKKTWMYLPARDPKSAASAATKAEVEKQANELIASALSPKHVEPPPG